MRGLLLVALLTGAVLLAPSASATWMQITASTLTVPLGTVTSGNLASTYASDGNNLVVVTHNATANYTVYSVLRPDTDAAPGQWTAIGCVAGSHWDCVDDSTFPPTADGNGTYVTTDGTAGEIVDEFTLTNIPGPYMNASLYDLTAINLLMSVRKNTSGTPVGFFIDLRNSTGYPCYTNTVAPPLPFTTYNFTVPMSCNGDVWSRSGLNGANIRLSWLTPQSNGPITVTAVAVLLTFKVYQYDITVGFDFTPTYPIHTVTWDCTATTSALSLYVFTALVPIPVTVSLGSFCQGGVSFASLIQSYVIGGVIRFLIGLTSGKLIAPATMTLDSMTVSTNGPSAPPPDITGDLGRLIFPIIFFVILAGVVVIAYVFRQRHGGI